MVRRILLPLDPSTYTDAALNLGCHIAKSTGAEIKGIAILDIPGIKKSVGSIPVGGIHYADRLIEARKQDATTHIVELLDKFKKKCQEESVPHRISEQQGSPSQVLFEKSVYFDLIVAGLRTFYQYGSENQEGKGIDEILGSTVTPILAVPKDFKVPDHRLRILIAFNNSLPAARAMHRFAQLVNTAHFEVKIMMAGCEKKEAEYCLRRAGFFLQSHGFKDVTTEWTPLGPIEAMKDKYLDWAEAVVLGIHSKRGIIDFMIGSLSKFMLNEGSKAVLIGQ